MIRKLEHATATDPIDQQLHLDQKEAAALLKWLGDGQLSMISDNALHPARTIRADETYIQGGYSWCGMRIWYEQDSDLIRRGGAEDGTERLGGIRR